MFQRRFSLPDHYSSTLETLLSERGYSLSEPRKLAGAVQKLSDYYLNNPEGATPWQEPWAQAGSLAYYFPLNYARNRAVAHEARRLGFLRGLAHLSDFGSGMGSALHAFRDTGLEVDRGPWNADAFDVSSIALELGQRLSPDGSAPHRSLQTAPRPGARTLLVASYVLTELEQLPDEWLGAEALALIEPSTANDARKLQALREPLIANGFRLWAPCTHERPCPLLVNSQKDWCHDRIHWDSPSWWAELEKHLPMKNRTLTFSYLLARKAPPPVRTRELARLIGDTLVEKGKSRQAVCRSPEREFLAWFPQRLRKGEVIGYERGNLIKLDSALEKKATEIRLQSPSDGVEIPPRDDLSDANA